ncbi:uncharacterized protein LOC107362310 [Tetranychus urticae]|uniref:uncharacterized protein LOC107362310 n=1 Tax=Tetranychus urticae TaxID=32264 RepID=UPI00077BABBB|nr:uncharacterized protein LOC107362310 [Tetranychus urticae]
MPPFAADSSLPSSLSLFIPPNPSEPSENDCKLDLPPSLTSPSSPTSSSSSFFSSSTPSPLPSTLFDSSLPSLVNNSIIENAEKAFSQLFQSLKKHSSTETKLYCNIEQLYGGVIQIASFAHEYNFQQVNANGYWTFVRSCTKLANMLKDRLSDLSIHDDLELLTASYLRLLNHILNFREITKSGIVDENFNNLSVDEQKLADQQQLQQQQQQKVIPVSRDEVISITDEDGYHQSNVQGNEISTDNLTEPQNFNHQSSKPILPLFVPPSAYSVDILREASSSQSQLLRLFSSFGAFWFCKSMRIFFEVYIFAVAFFGELFPFSLKTLWSRDYRADLFTKWTQCPSTSYPFDIWEILDYKVVCKGLIPLLFLGKGIQTRNIEASPQNTFVYTRDGKDVVVNQPGGKVTPSVNEKPIKCRLIHKSNRDTSKGYLLFHVHGGGFIAHSPDSHENYLRQWAHDVPDMTIFSVGYTLKQKFPTALQEVLDAYLWVTSGSPDVAQAIGFQPKKIIFCGDSAGANLALSLLLTLNDLSNRDPSDQRLRLPDGIFSIYGAFLLSPLVGPSRVMGAIDPLLSPGVLLTCGGVYGNIVDDQVATEESISLPRWDPCDGVAENVKRLLLATYSLVISMSSNQTQPWFICDKSNFSKKLKTLADRTHTPYASPLTYQKFDSLSKIPMQILTSEFCPLLDESITMAKLWKGPVNLDVMEDLPHGFLNFTIVSPEARKGALLCSQRLKEMFE